MAEKKKRSRTPPASQVNFALSVEEKERLSEFSKMTLIPQAAIIRAAVLFALNNPMTVFKSSPLKLK